MKERNKLDIKTNIYLFVYCIVLSFIIILFLLIIS